jgi:hypothetical protein
MFNRSGTMLNQLVSSLSLLFSLQYPILDHFEQSNPISNPMPPSIQTLEQKIGGETEISRIESPEKELPNGLEIIPLQIYLVTQIIGQNEFADQRPKFAKDSQKTELYLVLKAKVGEETVFYTSAKKIKIDGEKISSDQVKNWPSSLPKPEIEISKVEPMEKSYSYVSKSNPIYYVEVPISQDWEVKVNVHPDFYQDQFPFLQSGLGVMHYTARFKYQTMVLNTPSKESLRSGGLSEKVIRVSFRPDTDSWTDYLFEMFNTPYIWGSVTSQIDGQVGSDCTDFVLYGWRRAGHQELSYTWSEGLKRSRYTKPIVTISQKHDDRTIHNEREEEINYFTVNEGDLVFYYRHVAALYRDNGNKVLDCDDLVLHTLGNVPEIEKMCDAFGTPVEIRRWRN